MPQAHRFTHSRDQLCEIAQTLLGHARSLGASGCECEVSEGQGLGVTVRMGKVETLEHNRDKGVGVTVYLGARPHVRRGHASTSDFSAAALHSTVAAAAAIARYTAQDDCAGLPEQELLASKFPDLDLYHPWPITPEEAIELARRCESAAFAVSPKVTNSEGAGVSAQHSQFVFANSAGFMGGFPAARHMLSCSVIAQDRGKMQRDDWFSSSRVPERLARAGALGRYAAERALARLHAKKLATRQAPVLFEAPAATGLIGQFVAAVSGGSLYRKASFLLDSLGRQVFARGVTIDEKPLLPRELASSPFDEEGVATRTRAVVSGGVLEGYFLSCYSARKLGMQSTGSAGGSHNLIVRPGTRDFRAMLREMNRGLLVTELLGQGVNMVTGDYSRGAAGYWVENGEIVHPVEEVTIAGNLRDMFRGIVAVGNDMVVRGSRQSGSILVDNMTIAGA